MNINELKAAADVGLLAPAILTAFVVAGYRLVSSLNSFRRQSRKDFLEAWVKLDELDSFGRAVAIRHIFGVYLPICVIEKGCASPNPGSALLQISESWNLFSFDERERLLTWRRKRYISHVLRRIEADSMIAIMYVFTFISFVSGLIATGIEAPSSWVFWVLIPVSLGIALAASLHRDSLLIADKAAEMWLGVVST